MTREEALNILHNASVYHPDYLDALNMSIKALEQEPCEDAVSRQALKEHLRARLYESALNNTDYTCVAAETFEDIADNRLDIWISELPSVMPTRPNAHNNNEDYAECDQFVCSNCGIELQDWHRVERDEDDGEVSYHEYTFKFCPNCGAEMERENKE